MKYNIKFLRTINILFIILSIVVFSIDKLNSIDYLFISILIIFIINIIKILFLTLEYFMNSSDLDFTSVIINYNLKTIKSEYGKFILGQSKNGNYKIYVNNYLLLKSIGNSFYYNNQENFEKNILNNIEKYIKEKNKESLIIKTIKKWDGIIR